MPFVGLFLTILFIFMCATPLSYFHDAAADSPKMQNAALQPGAIREDAVRVVITRDGKVFFDGGEVATGELPALIRNAVGHGSERKVYLTIDRRTHYGDVNPVIDAIQLSGIKRVAVFPQNIISWR